MNSASIVDQTQFVNLARSRALAFGQTIITSLPGVQEEIASDSTGGIGPMGESGTKQGQDSGRGEDDLVVSDQSAPGGEGWKEGKGRRGL